MVKQLGFKILDSTEKSYPTSDYDGQEDQSYGFLYAFKLQTGNTRGTQIVGNGGARIDGANNRIIVTDASGSGSVGLGTIPGTTEFGFFSLDASGNVIEKKVLGTTYIYNPLDNFKNVLQMGILPDSSGGFAIAASGSNVADGF